MIEKNKNYTYEELLKIIKTVHSEAVNKLTNDLNMTKKDSENTEDIVASAMFTMQNIIFATEVERMLFEGSEN